MDTNLWHDLRAKNIGGSEVAALLGYDIYTSRLKLWHIKNGTMTPDDLSANEYVQAGIRYESVILSWANDKFGTDFVNPGIYKLHDTVKGMGCTPDGVSLSNPKVLAQVKTASPYVFARNWKVSDDGEIIDAPLNYILQCQHEMDCMNADENHLIVSTGFESPKRMIVRRDEALMEMIRGEVADFWNSIEANDPPSPDYAKDGEVIRKMREQSAYVEEEDFTGHNELSNALEEYSKLDAMIKDAESAKDAFKNQITHIIGNVGKAICGGYKISTVKSEGTPDKTITQDMVGQVIKGRAGWSSIRITQPKNK